MKNYVKQLRRLAFGLLLFVYTGTQAQNDTLTSTEEFDTYTNLDFARVPTDYLYDRIYPIAALDSIDSCDTITAERILQGWWELENSKIKGAPINTYDLTRGKVSNLVMDYKVPILSLDVEFGQIHPEAIDLGWMYMFDEVLYDAGLTNPYTQNHVGISALGTQEFEADETYKLFWSSDFVFSDPGKDVDFVVVEDPHGPATDTLYENDTLYKTYPNPDETITITITTYYNDGTKNCSKQKIRTKHNKGHGEDDPCEEGYLMIIKSDIPFRGYDELKPTTSIGDAHVLLRTTPRTDCKIMKPVIISDGFDPLDSRSWKGFIPWVDYDDGGNQKNLIADLRAEGYDVIIMNYPILGSPAIRGEKEVKQYHLNGTYDKDVSPKRPYSGGAYRDGGTDYIERNAFLMVKLIQELNDILEDNGSEEQLVVIGPSMGGLITRYALAYMEQELAGGDPDMDHNTRLWISFDSPHHGANIGLGTQYMLDWLGFRLNDKDKQNLFNEHLRSYAARQLLIESYDGYWSKHTYNSQVHHLTFYSDIEDIGLPGSNGFPQNLRKVSMLNGRIDGVKPFTPGAEYIYARGDKIGRKAFELRLKYMASYGQSSDVFYGYKLRPFRNGYVTIPFNNFNSKGSLDAMPGSIYMDPQDVTAKIKDGMKEKKLKNIVATGTMQYTFIPVVSSVAHTNPNFDWESDLSNIDLVCTGKTPFEDIYAPDENQRHIFITTGHAEWAIGELNNQIQLTNDLVGDDYNFGGHLRHGIGSLNVGAGSKLMINDDSPVGHQPGSLYGHPAVGSTFEVKSSTSECGGPEIVIKSNGLLQIGDNNGSTPNTGILRLQESGRLILENGSELLIHDGSELIIEEGAELILDPGYAIKLEGANAKITIKGVVTLRSGANFEFSKGLANEGGYIHVFHTDDNDGTAITATTPGSQIRLIGDNKATDLVAIVEDGEWEINQNLIANLEVSNGWIGMANNGRLDLNVSCNVQDATFSEIYSNAVNTAGITLNGQANVLIKNCDFKDLITGIDAKHGTSGLLPDISYCYFKDCYTGMKYACQELDGFNLQFVDCAEGLVATNIQTASEVTNSSFTRCATNGLDVSSTGLEYIYINECTFADNFRGAKFSSNTKATIKCSNFSSNDIAIEANADLNLSTTKTLFGKSGGNCTFWNNDAIGVEVHDDLYLDNGNNNFINSINPQYYFIMGEVAPTSLNSSYDLPANGNFWDPAPTNLSTAGSNYYQLTSNVWGYPQPVVLTGSQLSSYNNLCFTLPGGSSSSMTTGTEIIENEEEGVHVYPNPISDNQPITIETPMGNSGGPAVIEIYNAVGSLVYSATVGETKNEIIIDNHSLSAGMYLLKVRQQNRQSEVRLLVKN